MVFKKRRKVALKYKSKNNKVKKKISWNKNRKN
jgi:hypothetical protein